MVLSNHLFQAQSSVLVAQQPRERRIETEPTIQIASSQAIQVIHLCLVIVMNPKSHPKMLKGVKVRFSLNFVSNVFYVCCIYDKIFRFLCM